MTEKQIRIAWWVISGVGFTLMVICFWTGYEIMGWLIIFPATLIVRHIVTRRWYPNKPN
jgi:hypothetical protein